MYRFPAGYHRCAVSHYVTSPSWKSQGGCPSSSLRGWGGVGVGTLLSIYFRLRIPGQSEATNSIRVNVIPILVPNFLVAPGET